MSTFITLNSEELPSILLATRIQGISSLYSRSSLYHIAKFLYVGFLVTSNTLKIVYNNTIQPQNFLKIP